MPSRIVLNAAGPAKWEGVENVKLTCVALLQLPFVMPVASVCFDWEETSISQMHI